ncbi:hypothetical protein I4U23_017169 [Adineta vaga]|nr:hypothetical protein I4U23_017169 [Adineta vaga]
MLQKNCQARYAIACAEKEEYQALQAFKTIVEKKPIWNFHLLLKPKIKKWSDKLKNFHIAQKRIEYNLPPKFITKNDFSFKFDTTSFERDEIQPNYNEMRQLTDTFQKNSMKYYFEIVSREANNDKSQIDIIMENCRPRLTLLNQHIISSDESNSSQTRQENDDILNHDIKCYEAFENYYKLIEKRITLQAEQACYFLEEEQIEDKIDKEIVPNQLPPPPTTATTDF